MRTVEILQNIAGIVGALMTGLVAVEQLLVKRFHRAGATSADGAITIDHPRPVTRWRLARLKSAGAVVVDQAGRYYLDEAAYRALRRRRSFWAVGFVLVALTFFIVIHVVQR